MQDCPPTCSSRWHPPQQHESLEVWVRSHHRNLLDAYSRVRAHVQQRQSWDQARYNAKAQDLLLLPGERVLVGNFRRRAQGKLAPRWMPGPSVIVSQTRPGQPVYVIRPEGKDGPTRTYHRNNLWPCPVDTLTPAPVSPETLMPPAPELAPNCPLEPEPCMLLVRPMPQPAIGPANPVTEPQPEPVISPQPAFSGLLSPELLGPEPPIAVLGQLQDVSAPLANPSVGQAQFGVMHRCRTVPHYGVPKGQTWVLYHSGIKTDQAVGTTTHKAGGKCHGGPL